MNCSDFLNFPQYPQYDALQIERVSSEPARPYADHVNRYVLHQPGGRGMEDVREILHAVFKVGLHWASNELELLHERPDGTFSFTIRTPYTD